MDDDSITTDNDVPCTVGMCGLSICPRIGCCLSRRELTDPDYSNWKCCGGCCSDDNSGGVTNSGEVDYEFDRVEESRLLLGCPNNCLFPLWGILGLIFPCVSPVIFIESNECCR